MADNILASVCQSESRQAAKTRRLDTYCEDSTSVPPEMFVDSNHPNKVLEGLNRLRINSVLCDVILCCEGQEFPCHRYLLASFSSYFQAMFTSGMVESTQERVTIGGVEPQMIGLLVNYAYTSTVSISAANVQALLAASNLLEVTAVREACCDYMERHMNINNCVGIYCIAEAHSCKMLEKHSMDYIVEHFSVIYQQEEFLSLSVERLTPILASDHLNVPKEDMVFEATMLWLDKCATRKQSFDKVLEQIRLPLISPSYLHTVVESLDVLKEYQGCQRFISEAKEWLLVPNRNTARTRMTTVIVVLGEEENDFHKVESFDPLTSQWMTLGLLPVKSEDYAVVSSGSTLYLAGGYDPCMIHDGRQMWRYDVHHNWSKMAPMNKIRSSFSLVMLDGYVFAVGGDMRGETFEKSIERYDPKTNTWQLMSVIVQEYYDSVGGTVVALHGHLYFLGSAPPPDEPPPTRSAKFNPETSEWTEIAPMQIPRDRAAACTLNGKIYVTGGVHYNENDHQIKENTMECYNPTSNQWTMCAPMKVRRFSHYVVAADEKIYVLGGEEGDDDEDGDDGVAYDKDNFNSRGGPLENIERYCEKTDMWETVEKMAAGHIYSHGCVSLRLRSGLTPTVDEDGSL